MHQETIPAPLNHGDDALKPAAPAISGLVWKVVAIGIFALYLIAPLLR